MTDRLPEDQNWVSMHGLTRRAAMGGGLVAAGFAAACQPIASTTLRTDAAGLKTGMTVISTGADSFAMPAFMARPSRLANPPLVIVVHEVFGVHEWIKDICRRFAQAGYMAVAPDLFARTGDATSIADIPTLIRTIVSKTPDAQVLGDIDATISWAGQQGADVTSAHITGFCWGGRIVWLYAAHNPSLKSGVAYYGKLTGERSALQPHNPLDLVGQLKAPVLGQYGGKDKGIPLTDVEEMRGRLKRAGSPSGITIHPAADHGFMADYRPSFDPEASAAAWRETLGWFARYR